VARFLKLPSRSFYTSFSAQLRWVLSSRLFILPLSLSFLLFILVEFITGIPNVHNGSLAFLALPVRRKAKNARPHYDTFTCAGVGTLLLSLTVIITVSSIELPSSAL
jgi:hypothetical protein